MQPAESPNMSFICPETDGPLSLSPQGVLENLPFLAIFERRDGSSESNCCFLNVNNGQILAISKSLPPTARNGSSVVVYGNHIYVLGGFCSGDSTCPDKIFNEYHSHNLVLHYDFGHPENGWTTDTRNMLERRYRSSCVVFDGKIYIFGSCRMDASFFGEVFDISQNTWDPLPSPDKCPIYISYPVFFDSSCSQILVYEFSKHRLYAFSIHDRSWQCLDNNFVLWSSAIVIVDGVIYSFCTGSKDYEYCLSSSECSVRAYDVVQKKELPTKWLSQVEVHVPKTFTLRMFHLGNDKFCFTWYSRYDSEADLKYMKFSVCKYSEEIHLTGESESVTSVPLGARYCEFGFF